MTKRWKMLSLGLMLTVAMLVSVVAAATFRAKAALPTETEPSYNLALNGDFAMQGEEFLLGADYKEKFSQLWYDEYTTNRYNNNDWNMENAAWSEKGVGLGNMYTGSTATGDRAFHILGAGAFVNYDEGRNKGNVVIVPGKGDGWDNVKIEQYAVANGLVYKLANFSTGSTLIKPGKKYKVSVKATHQMGGHYYTLQFRTFCSDGSLKDVAISETVQYKEGNVAVSVEGTFGYDFLDGKCVVHGLEDTVIKNNQGGDVTKDTLIGAYIVLDTRNDGIYFADDFVIEEVYDAKITVNNDDAEAVTDLTYGDFQVNGEDITEDDLAHEVGSNLYVIKNLTGESVVALKSETATSKGITIGSTVTLRADSMYVDTAENAMGSSRVRLVDGSESYSAVFGTPAPSDIRLKIEDSESAPITDAVITVDGYEISDSDKVNGNYVISQVPYGEKFDITVRAVGKIAKTVKINTEELSSYTVKLDAAKENPADNKFVNGFMETKSNDMLIAYSEDNEPELDSADLDNKWRALGSAGKNPITTDIAWGNYAYSGLGSLDATITTGGGDTGIVYRFAANAFAGNGTTFYSFGGKVRAINPSEGNDAVYLGFTPVLKLKNGDIFTYVPAEDFGVWFNNCRITDIYPLNTWRDISGMISVNTSNITDFGVFEYTIGNTTLRISDVQAVIGYDFYIVMSKADAAKDSITVCLDELTLTEMVGFNGKDLGADSTNIFPNGDFSDASSLGIGQAYGYWFGGGSTQIAQSSDTAYTGITSLKAEINTNGVVETRQWATPGSVMSQMSDASFNSVSGMKPKTTYRISGYAKGPDNADLIFGFRPALFCDGINSDPSGKPVYPFVRLTSGTVSESEWINISTYVYFEFDYEKCDIAIWSWAGGDRPDSPTWRWSDVADELCPSAADKKIYELHALDFIVYSYTQGTYYLDTFTAYSAYTAEVSVKGADGAIIKTQRNDMKFVDYLGNEINDLNVVFNAETGIYTISDITAGPVRISLTDDASYPEQLISINRTTLVLEKPFDYKLIIKTPDGAVLGADAVQLIIRQDGQNVGFATWNDDDSVTINQLIGSNISVTISAQGYQNYNLVIDVAGEQTVTLVKEVRLPFRGTVTITDADGNPVKGVTVTVKRGDTAVEGITVREMNGVYTITGLNDDAEGSLVLVMSKDGYTFPEDVVISRADANKSVTATVVAAGGNEPQPKKGCGCKNASVGAGAGVAGFGLMACAALLAKKRSVKKSK